MIKVITSCITFSCINVKGPPFSTKPIRLAGTWNTYSKKAMLQEKATTPISGKESNQLKVCFIFKCPYQAKVINILETTNNPIVQNAFIFILLFIR